MEPYCDSDEEVFFGPVTLKEVKKALTLRRRTEMHVPISSTAEADSRKKLEARIKEQLPHNLTFTPQMNNSKGKEIWDRRSLDVNAVKLFTEDEAPAPPPSPEKMEYNGSPFPTPCNQQNVCHSRLHLISEEDETDKQLSILTTMNDSLTEDVKALPIEQNNLCNINIKDIAEEANINHKPTEESTNGRHILLEKMKEYETQEQQIKSLKRGPLHKVALEDSLIELSTDDLLILNDVENDDYFSEESSGSPAVHPDDIEVKEDEPASIVPKCTELPSESISDLRFSRLVPERIDDSYENQHLEHDNSFLGDFERRYGKHRLNEVLASLNSEEESPERIRPVSPEYDNVSVNADKSCETTYSSDSVSSEISLSDSVVEISVLKDDFSTEVEQLSHDFSNVSVAEPEMEALSDQTSRSVQKSITKIDSSVTSLSDDDLSESARMVSNESHLPYNQSSRGDSSEYGDNSKMANDLTKSSIQLEDSTCNSRKEVMEIENTSCARETTCQDSSINLQTSSDRICKIPFSSQKYVETKSAETVCNNPSNMGVKSYIMSDEYSLISDAESEPNTPNKKDTAYSTKPCISMASFGDKVVPVVDDDGGFLSVLSAAALMHASLTHHNISVSGKQLDVDLADVDRTSVQVSEHETNSTHDQVYASVNTEHEAQTEPLLNKSDANKECGASEIHSNLDSMNIDRQHYDNLQMSNEGLEVDYCAGETNALDDLSETDKECLENHASLDPPTDTDKFNDTLEVMDMLLKLGASYQLSNNDDDLSNSAHKFPDEEGTLEHLTPNQNVEQNKNIAMKKSEDTPNITETKAQKSPRLPSTFEVAHNLPECSISPIPCDKTSEKSHLPVIKKNASCPNPDKMQPPVVNKTKAGTKELQSPFKVPTKPISQAALRPGTPRIVKQKPVFSTPTASSPFKKAGYKKIVSPVGMYIHNTPSPSLVTNIKPKAPSPRCRTTRAGPAASTPVSSCMQHTPEKPKACVVSKSNAENIDINNIHPVLPMVSYKSAPALKLDEKEMEKLPRMNDRMKKLIDTPRPHVIRHEGRVKVEPIPHIKKFASPKQFKCTDNSFNASDPEISVVVQKKVTRTNTVGI